MRKAPNKDDLMEMIATSLRPQWRVGIVYSGWYKEEVEELIKGAQKVLREMGIKKENITLHQVPGCFEIPLIGAGLAESKRVDALIGIGVIVEGETAHGRLIAESVSRGMMDIQLKYQIPFAFEVLYVDSLEQVKARLDKGEEAAIAVLHSLAQLTRLQS